MSNNKHFADLLKVCSILPALAIMPAMAGSGLENIGILDYSETYDLYSMNPNNLIAAKRYMIKKEALKISEYFIKYGKIITLYIIV